MSSFLFGIFFFSPSKESSFLSSLFMRPHVARENFGDDDDDDDDDVPKREDTTNDVEERLR